MRTRLTALACGALLLGGSGCLSSRALGPMAIARDKNVTLLQTQDTYSFAWMWPVKTVHQFWKCSESPGEISCKKVCSTDGSDLLCQSTGFVP